MTKVKPSRDPKFHQAEMFDGDGKIISELLMIFNRGCVFHILWVICFYS